jgi:exonuclease SbcC
MKPVELSLEGYGSYREPQVIDFSSVRLACITGRNGAGKSSILDGLSWALLGITRTGDIDQVISEGMTSATVAVVFDHDGDRWRVTRSRTRARKTTARLERSVDGQFEAIEGPGVRAVDSALGRMLRIDPETFASTVLLAQGDSGRFAEADPARRKKILADILSLDRYSVLAKAARDAQRDARRSHDDLQVRIGELDTKIATAASDSTALAEANQQLGVITTQVSEARGAVAQLDAQLASQQTAAEQLKLLSARLDEAQRTAASRADAAAQTARRAAEALRRGEQAVLTIDQRHSKALQARETAADARAAAGELSTKITAIDSELADVVEAGQSARESIQALAGKIEQLNTTVAEAGERIVTLGRTGAGCFTCGSPLTGDQRATLIADLTATVQAAQAAIDATASAVAAAEEKRTSLLDHHRALIADRTTTMAAFDRQTRRAIEADAVAADVDRWASELEQAETLLADAKTTYETAAAALALSDEDPQTVSLREDIERVRGQLAALPAVVARRSAAVHNAETLDRTRADLLAHAGALRERLTGYETLRSERAKALGAAGAFADEISDYGSLAQAFGPDGIPHLVFSSVVSELEVDADELMATLTDGQLRLELRTTATTKATGETTEALDVVVVTPAGERPYAALSGGERFRVDLALRVALARLLSRRSGSRIELLALDEGWGSLDPEGIRAMLEALRGVHDEFGLVLTITHTPEVAAAFEARYEIERDVDGTSVVSMVAG